MSKNLMLSLLRQRSKFVLYLVAPSLLGVINSLVWFCLHSNLHRTMGDYLWSGVVTMVFVMVLDLCQNQASQIKQLREELAFARVGKAVR